MSAVTIAPAKTEAEIIVAARGVLSRAESGDVPWPDGFTWTDGFRGSFRMARCGLRETLEIHELIKSEIIHPASEFADLEDEAGAYGIALSRIAEDISTWAEALVLVIAEHCGTKAADYVSGADRPAGE
jgi:hypothetical protein